MEEEALVCFESVTQAIMAEQALGERKFPVRVMPTPAGIREGCGFCLRFLPDGLAEAAALLAERGISLDEAYLRDPGGAAYRKIPIPSGGPHGGQA